MSQQWAKAFYNSKQWADTRKYVLRRDYYLCQFCGEPAAEVHHKTFLNADNIKDSSVSLNPVNLISLCRNCHLRQHDKCREAKRFVFYPEPATVPGIYFDGEGNMVQGAYISIISGAPGSGKTTYIKEHMKRGDLIVDMDNILEALSFIAGRNQPNELLDITLHAIESIYQYLEEHKGRFTAAWIATTARGFNLDNLRRRLNATLIHMDVSKEECIRRINNDDSRVDKDLFVQLINKYFDTPPIK